MEPQGEENVHPETLEQGNPEFVSNIGYEVTSILMTYGWYIILLGFAALFAWHKWLKAKYENWRTEKAEREYDARYHKNPDIGVGRARQEAMVAARRRQQEELERASALSAEMEKEREEQKRLEKEGERQRLSGVDTGRRLGNTLDTVDDTAKANAEIMKKGRAFKSDFNPLDGSGGSGGYRAPQKGCPGGGCGRR